MNILIVEDEPLAAQRLADLVHQYESHIRILTMTDSIESTVSWLRSHPQPDLIFMDIQLADGLSFGVFDQIPVKSPVIFTTAFDEYAIRAFRVNSIDYLLKPLDFEAVAQALDKYVDLHMKKQAPPAPISIETLREMMSGMQQNYKTRFVVKKGEHLVSISTGDILYFFSEDKATLFRTLNNKKYVVDFTLSELEAQLDPATFFRLNRTYLARLEAITDILTYSASRLKITLQHSSDEVFVSKQRVGEFKEWLGK